MAQKLVFRLQGPTAYVFSIAKPKTADAISPMFHGCQGQRSASVSVSAVASSATSTTDEASQTEMWGAGSAAHSLADITD